MHKFITTNKNMILKVSNMRLKKIDFKRLFIFIKTSLLHLKLIYKFYSNFFLEKVAIISLTT